MLFLNTTPRMIADGLARQESRKASKRKSTQGSDMELSTKEQKLSHNSLPPDPGPALAPTLANSQTNVTTGRGLTCEGPKLVDASLAPSQAQTRVVADSGMSIGKPRDLDDATSLAFGHDVENRGMTAQTPRFDHCSVPAAAQVQTQVQAHNNEDLAPFTKKTKLSYANMHPGRRPRARLLEAQKADIRKRYEKYCASHGCDQNLLDRSLLPDDVMIHPKFNVYKYLATQSSKVHSDSYGQPDLGCYRLVGSSSRELTADSTELDGCRGPGENSQDHSHHPPAHDSATPVRPVPARVSLNHTTAQIPISRGCCCSENERSFDASVQEATSTTPLSLRGKVNESCPYLDDRTFTLMSSTDSTLEKPLYSFPGFDHEKNTTPASSHYITSIDTNRSLGDDCSATSLDQEGVLRATDIPDTELPDTGIPETEFPDTELPDTELPDTDIPDTDIPDSDIPQSDPSTLGSSLRKDATPASLPQNPSVGPARNKGGRPRLERRKPRARKTPKGQTRLQKNHPIKATVNVDVWENILVFCPPEFLLKARNISRTFRSILKDDSLIWKRARVKYFGPDLPEPPLGLTEPQYVDLLTGSGCQTRGCTSSKTRKTYWAIQKRLCIECFQKSFLPVSKLICNIGLLNCFQLTYTSLEHSVGCSRNLR